MCPFIIKVQYVKNLKQSFDDLHICYLVFLDTIKIVEDIKKFSNKNCTVFNVFFNSTLFRNVIFFKISLSPKFFKILRFLSIKN